MSTDDQAQTKSCDDQKTTNDRFIASQGWELAKNADYRDEGISGSSLERPGLQDLLIRCQEDSSIKAVVVTETDRLARGNLAYITIRESLKKYSVKVFAVTQPMIDDSEEGEMLGEIMGAINGFFSNITRRKSMRALDEKAARGWWPGWAPLGYKNVNVGTEEKPERIIEIDEEKAPFVKLMPKLYNQGLSYQEISDKLYDEGLSGKSGGKVSPEEIRKIIFSDFYLGEFWWRGKKYKGNHPPLFNYLEVQKARNRSQEKGHVHSGQALKDKFIFKRLPFYCGFCKTLRITAECKVKHYKKRDAEYIFYHCTKSYGGWKQCTQPSLNQDDLIIELAEKAVKPVDLGDDLAEFIFEEMNRDFLQKKEGGQTLVESMNRRLGQIETELKNLFEMRIAGKILPMDGKTSDQVYEEYRLKKEVERKNILIAKKKLEENSQEWRQKASNFLSLCQNATNQFLKAQEEKQYLFLRKISSNLFLKDKEVIVTHRFPFSGLLEITSHPTVLRG
ncbi:hypothetical protein A3F62_04875 [Candidatus Woesebacteria bacterium RIFCSPHIGHO2_12_FULL_44_11]|nr:MAG: hypothetical protein A3F62_04875 [Candidatus Woesebacteria bacterium RIFCSPHIGHO2_12_FULL_44_11]